MITVPLSALSDASDDGESIAPVVGDVIDLGKAQATVDSIDGDMATLSIQSVNGAKVGGEDEDEDEAVEDLGGMEDAILGAGDKAMAAKLFKASALSDKRAGR